MSVKILIADDSSSLRSIVRTTLENNNYSVIEAENGSDALNKLTEDVKLVISDINMPVMDGIELIKNVRKHQYHKTTPVLVLTTETQEDLKEKAKEAGATGWIVKPFNEEKILSAIKKLIA